MANKRIVKSRSIFTATNHTFLDGFLTIAGSEITGVYPAASYSAFDKTGYQLVDYGEQTITPGFVEAHAHIYMSALVHCGKIKLVDNTSAKTVITSLKSQFKSSEQKGSNWLVGKDWYAPSWQDQSLPTRFMLDEVFPEVPVAILAADLHTIWVNTLGFKKLFNTLVPEKNTDLVYDAAGQVTGIIKEATGMSCLSQILASSTAEKASVIAPYLTYLASLGITAISDMSAMPALTKTGLDDQVYPESYALIAERKALPVRVNLFPFFKRDIQQLKKMKYRFNSKFLKIAGGKLFFDGVTSSHTAWVKAPYESTAEVGAPIVEPDVMRQLIFTAQKNSWPLRIHTIGDKASFTALTYFKEALAKFGPMRSGTHCLEHLEMMDQANIQLMKKAKVLASVQPSHPLMDYQTIHIDVGKREATMWPFKTYVDKQIPLAFGTDSPVVNHVSPLANIYYAMTRQTLEKAPADGWYPEQRLSLADSLIAHTSGGAKANNLATSGTLQAGRQADYVVLNRNLKDATPDEVSRAAVAETYVAGNLTYQHK